MAGEDDGSAEMAKLTFLNKDIFIADCKSLVDFFHGKWKNCIYDLMIRKNLNNIKK